MILAWLLHSIYSTVIAFILALLFGKLSLTLAIVSLILGAYLGRKHSRSLRLLHPDWKFGSFDKGSSGLLEIGLSVFVLFAAYRHFAWMIFPLDHNFATLSANNFGDLPLHVNYIRAFANGVAFPPINPIFTAEPLRYPYGADLYNALWEVAGVELSGHLFLVGLFGTLASLVFLRSYAGWWGIGAFFFSGGYAGWHILQGVRFEDIQAKIEWKNLFLAVFITQRGMLLALPIGLLLLIAIRRHMSGLAQLSSRQLTWLGVLWGFLPLFHLHSFVILSLILASIAWEHGGWRATKNFLVSRMALVAYVPAISFILYSTGFLKRAGVVHWDFGWMAGEGKLIEFLFFNFGPWLLVPILIALVLVFSRKTMDKTILRRYWIEWATYSVLFLLFFNLMLAPWAWDNIKLLIWPYLGFARLARQLIEPRLGHTLGGLEKPLVAAILCLTGFVLILASLREPEKVATVVYQASELAYTEGALAKVPAEAVFASGFSHNHPLTYFGRLRVHGYDGHLWSHGIDSGAVGQKLRSLMAGDENWRQSMRDLGVTHIFWSPVERSAFGEGERPWMRELPNVSRVKDYGIFALE